jgi:MOSC domain-containing protein YiiM
MSRSLAPGSVRLRLMETAQGQVASVSSNGVYSFTKPARDEIVLIAGLGVEGDTHAGVHVRHRHRVKVDPAQPNLRQVHLIHEELFADVAHKGYEVRPGNLGENVTTRGLDLLGLPMGTILRFGVEAEPAEWDAGVLEAVRAAVAREAAAGPARGIDPRPALVVAGLRNPCQQINKFQPGLLKEVIGHDEKGDLVRKGGVMAVVLRGGVVRPGDAVTAELPLPPHARLEPV